MQARICARAIIFLYFVFFKMCVGVSSYRVFNECDRCTAFVMHPKAAKSRKATLKNASKIAKNVSDQQVKECVKCHQVEWCATSPES